MAAEESSLIYLEKNRLFFFDGEKIFKLDFPPETIKDIDILNEDQVLNILFDFIDKINTAPSRFLFVLSESVIFSEETMQTDPVKLEAETQNFIGVVPFDSVMEKNYQDGKGIRMIATNAELVDLISDAFEKKGFARDGVVPAMVFGAIETKKGLDAAGAKFIMDNHQQAHGKSMVVASVLPAGTGSVFRVTTTGKNTILPYLVGFFALAALGLIALMYFRR